MDYIFVLKLVVSFLIGAIWVIFATVSADKYGSKIGGLVAGLPSTGLFSLLFLAWTQNPQIAVQATTIIPIIVGAENLFVVSYILLIKKNLWLALSVAFIIWFSLALVLFLLRFNNFGFSVATYAISLFISYFIIEHILDIKSAKGRKVVYTTKIIFLRGLLSGSIVALAVFLGKIGGPILGGIFSAFPAMFTSTMIITYFAHGAQFSAATMKSSVLTLISLVIHSAMVRYTYVPFGIIWGTILSTAVSFTSGFLIYKIVVSKVK